LPVVSLKSINANSHRGHAKMSGNQFDNGHDFTDKRFNLEPAVARA
jgi:hypothetical protein